MEIPTTWEQSRQPDDEETAGDVWFWSETYREFHAGLKLTLAKLRVFEDVARELELTGSPYNEQVQRLEQLISWGEGRLNATPPPREIRESLVTFGSLRYLKAGALIRAQQLIERRQEVLGKHRVIPRSVLQAFDARIQQLVNLAEQGLLNGLRPAELFFEIAPSADAPSGTPETPVAPRGLTTKALYASDVTIVDPILRERCLHIFNTFDATGIAQQFDTVVREMSVVLEDRVRQLSGLAGNLAGAELFSAAMTGEAPRIRFGDRKDLQDAAHLLFRGYSGFVRNEVMHRLVGGFTRERVLQLLGMVDYLLDLLAHAQVSRPES